MTEPAPITLAELAARHDVFARQYYRHRDGSSTGHAQNLASVMARLVRYCPERMRADQLTRHLMRAWLDQLAAEGLTRQYCNKALGYVRQVIRYGVDLDLLPPSVEAELRLVRPLKPHRSAARETDRPAPPPEQTVKASTPNLGEVWRDVCKLLQLTAMRPGEILSLRAREVVIPLGVPERAHIRKISHKTAHKGRERIVPIGPEAAAILKRYTSLLFPDDYLFAGRGRREHLTTDALRKAIVRACSQAGVPRWRPYDLRRAAARTVRAREGLDAAQALLGHANANTTEVYAPILPSETPSFQLAQRGVDALGDPQSAREPSLRREVAS